MKVREAMTADVAVASPDQTIADAARLMADRDIGALPVGDVDRLVGMVTDRDLVVRALARNLGPQTLVRDVMSAEVMYCFDDEELDVVAENMADIQVRRLPVVNRDKRLVGIVSFGDVAAWEQHDAAGKAIAGICNPGGPHSHTAH